MVPVIIGALGTVSKDIEKWLAKTGVTYRLEALQKACLLGTARMLRSLRACLHEGGGPQVGEVTCGGLPHRTCKRDHIKMRDCMDRRVTQLSGLPHLPGVPHLHVNRPLDT